MKPNPTDTLYKPDFDGERPNATLSGPERNQHRLVKRAVIDRVHRAMLTLNALPRVGPKANLAGGTPPYIVEFSDRVGAELEEPKRARYEPSATDVTDMVPALELLKGLSRPFYKVVMLRALNEFAVDEGETEPFPWDVIGEEAGGMSGKWAEDAYNAAIVQATRRAGLLPMVSRDYGIVAVAFWVERGWLTKIATASDPRQAVSNAKASSPVKPDQAFALWVPGQMHAKQIVDATRPQLRGLHGHAAFYKVHPDVLSEQLIEAARGLGVAWTYEDIAVRGAMAA
jgi:hypothetical protein